MNQGKIRHQIAGSRDLDEGLRGRSGVSSGFVDTTDRDRYIAAGGIVPEPGSLVLLSSGLAALAWLRSRRRL